MLGLNNYKIKHNNHPITCCRKISYKPAYYTPVEDVTRFPPAVKYTAQHHLLSS